MKIKSLRAFKVLNSRAQPTIAVQVNNASWAGAPEGASEGKKEVLSFPKGVDHSVVLFNKISKDIIGLDISKFSDLEKVELKLNATLLGGAPIIALEFALLKQLALDANKEIYRLIGKPKRFPLPLGNVIGGGAHAGFGDIQECLLSPQTKTFTEAAFINAEIHRSLKAKLKQLDPSLTGGKTDEGAWISRLPDIVILEFINRIRGQAEKDYKVKILLGLDLAASQYFGANKYNLSNYSLERRKISLTSDRYFSLLQDWIKEFDLNYIEDPFEETDVRRFAELKSTVRSDRIICSDDLTCTNIELLQKVIKNNAANAVIVKPNQIGSLIKTQRFVELARKHNMKIVISHRSGEMPDAVLAHLALGFGADYFKCGIAGGERVSKINELIKLERFI